MPKCPGKKRSRENGDRTSTSGKKKKKRKSTDKGQTTVANGGQTKGK